MRKPDCVLASLVLAAFAVITFSAPQQDSDKQEKVPYYHVETRLVAMPVYVIDQSGKPVTDLSKDDFEVTEGRTRCKIEAVEFIDHRTTTRKHYEVIPPESRRQFLLLFDLSFSNLAGLKAARTAGIDFLLENTTPNDLVAVITVSQRGGLSLLCPFGTKRSQAVHAITTLGFDEGLKYRDPAGFAFDDILTDLEGELASMDSIDTDASLEGAEMALENISSALKMSKGMDQSRYVGVVSRYMGVMQALAFGLQLIHGRKNVILFSEGFDDKALTGKTLNELAADQEAMATLRIEQDNIPDSSTTSGSIQLQRVFANTLDEFRQSHSVFYVIDVGRMKAGGEAVELQRRTQNTLFQFANETNGILFKNLNDLPAVLADVAERTSAGYLLIFEPSKQGRPGEFRKVGVSVKRSGLEVDHQSGYYFEKEYKDFTPLEKMSQLSEYVSKDIVSQRIPFTFEAHVFTGDEQNARIPVVIEVGGENIVSRREKRKSDVLALEIYGYLLDVDNKPLDFFYDILSFKTKEMVQKLESSNLMYYGLLLAPPGNYKVKCMVRDSELGKISSSIQTVNVPDFAKTGLHMSGPIFVNSSTNMLNVMTAANQQPVGRREGKPVTCPYLWKGNIWVPKLNPVIDFSRQELFFVSLTGLELHPTAKIPQVSMKFETVNANGDVKTLGRVALAEREEDQEHGIFKLMFQVDFSDQGLGPGRHLLRFTLTDNLAGNAVSAEVPFTVKQAASGS